MSTAIEESLRAEVERLSKERDAAVAERWTALEQARDLRSERWSAHEQVRELRAEVERLLAGCLLAEERENNACRQLHETERARDAAREDAERFEREVEKLRAALGQQKGTPQPVCPTCPACGFAGGCRCARCGYEWQQKGVPE